MKSLCCWSRCSGGCLSKEVKASTFPGAEGAAAGEGELPGMGVMVVARVCCGGALADAGAGADADPPANSDDGVEAIEADVTAVGPVDDEVDGCG